MDEGEEAGEPASGNSVMGVGNTAVSVAEDEVEDNQIKATAFPVR